MSFYGDAGLQNLELCIQKIITNNYVTLKKTNFVISLKAKPSFFYLFETISRFNLFGNNHNIIKVDQRCLVKDNKERGWKYCL